MTAGDYLNVTKIDDLTPTREASITAYISFSFTIQKILWSLDTQHYGIFVPIPNSNSVKYYWEYYTYQNTDLIRLLPDSTFRSCCLSKSYMYFVGQFILKSYSK